MDRRKGMKVKACEDGDKGKEAEGMLIEIDLPTGVMMEILSRLPLKSVSKCRFVCKTWFQIISDPHFAKLHLSRSPISTLTQLEDEPNPRYLNGPIESRCLRMYQIVRAPDNFTHVIKKEETIFQPRLNHLPDCSFNLVNSCNGLVFLSGTERKLVYVCNPFLGEFITIRVPEGDKRTSNAFCFGFNVKTNQYKVVQTVYVNGEGPKAEVYTLGTGSWTSLGNAPFSIGRMRFNTFLHGACHWVNDHKIACFDFEKDLFREVPAPPQYKPEGDDLLMLGVIEDSLCASCYRDDGSLKIKFDIWVMKDYGVKESWTTQFRITFKVSLYNRHCDYCYPLMLLKNGTMLLSYNDDDVVCYNMKRTKKTVFFSNHYLNIVAYTPCFVSLMDVAKGEQISRGGKPIN